MTDPANDPPQPVDSGASALARLLAVAERFSGISVERRRTEKNWPAQWRINVYTSKNERSAYRIERWGRSADEAAQEVLDAIAIADRATGRAGATGAR